MKDLIALDNSRSKDKGFKLLMIRKKKDVEKKDVVVEEKENDKTMFVHEYQLLHDKTNMIVKMLKLKHENEVSNRDELLIFPKKYKYFKKIFKAFPKLKVFRAPNIIMTNNIEVNCMKRCKKFVALNVSNSKFTGKGLKHLSDNLERLDISCCRFFHKKNWMYVVELKKLHTLNVSFIRSISDDFLEMIKGRRLKCLSLDGCVNVTDIGISHLQNMHLTILNIRGTKVTDKGLVYLQKIKWLNIQKTKVTDIGLKWLSEVETLLITFQDYYGITGSGLGDLKKLKNLTVDKVDGNFFEYAATLFLRKKNPNGYVLRSLTLMRVGISLKYDFHKAVKMISNGVKNLFIPKVHPDALLSLSDLKNVHTLTIGKISSGKRKIEYDIGTVVSNKNIKRVYIGKECLKKHDKERDSERKKKKEEEEINFSFPPKEYRI